MPVSPSEQTWWKKTKEKPTEDTHFHLRRIRDVQYELHGIVKVEIRN